jgi:hypothetical protein
VTAQLAKAVDSGIGDRCPVPGGSVGTLIFSAMSRMVLIVKSQGFVEGRQGTNDWPA